MRASPLCFAEWKQRESERGGKLEKREEGIYKGGLSKEERGGGRICTVTFF